LTLHELVTLECFGKRENDLLDLRLPEH